MNAEAWIKLAELGFVLAQALFLFLMFVLRGTFASKKDAQGATDRADSAHHRLDLLDERLKGFPDYDVTNEIRDDFSQMREAHAAMTTEIRILRETVQRMDDFLRQKQ